MASRVYSDVPTIGDCPMTDSGNADYFESEADHRLAFDHTSRQWLFFNGHYWQVDARNEVQERAVDVIRQRQHEALQIADLKRRESAVKFAIRSENRQSVDNLLALSRSRPTIAVDASVWDTRPFLFGVQNGVVDLETGRLRPGCPSDRIKRVSPVRFDPDAIAPRFERFIHEIFQSRPDVVDWLQRVLGYALTADTSEQMFWIWWGIGSNGKSTLLTLLLRQIFGADDDGHGWTIPFPTATWTTAISDYQRAELPGRRFVVASEVKRQAPLHEDFLKSLTGGDRVNARAPYGRPFTFTPICKFTLVCNERPIIRDLTHSMWRRVRLVPFVETFPVDDTLASALAAESSGVLNWLIRGCLDWQRDRLRQTPSSVDAATKDYHDESDHVLVFLAERCDVMDGLSVGAKELFVAYRTWIDARHLADADRLNQTTFGVRMKSQFVNISASDRKVIYGGLALKANDD